MTEFVFEERKKLQGKHICYRHFSFFFYSTMFLKFFPLESVKVGMRWKELKQRKVWINTRLHILCCLNFTFCAVRYWPMTSAKLLFSPLVMVGIYNYELKVHYHFRRRCNDKTCRSYSRQRRLARNSRAREYQLWSSDRRERGWLVYCLT